MNSGQTDRHPGRWKGWVVTEESSEGLAHRQRFVRQVESVRGRVLSSLVKVAAGTRQSRLEETCH